MIICNHGNVCLIVIDCVVEAQNRNKLSFTVSMDTYIIFLGTVILEYKINKCYDYAMSSYNYHIIKQEIRKYRVNKQSYCRYM